METTAPPTEFAAPARPEAPVEAVPEPQARSKVIRRNGKLTAFDRSKIAVALTKAFLAVEGQQAAGSRRIHETVERLTDQVVESLFRRLPDGGTVHIEDIQDQVELALMRAGEHKVARGSARRRRRAHHRSGLAQPL